jgi:tRNA(Arg) A34 adenosine deaminase TadA
MNPEPIPGPRDLYWLRRAIALSQTARELGHHPFACLIVDAGDEVIAQAMNASASDRTSHAEMVALRAASSAHQPERLREATLYTSAEPCAMCAAGAYWTGIGRVVYGLAEERLLGLTGNHPENPTLSLSCREVFARGQRAIEVIGPVLEDEALRAHEGFWSPPSGLS